MKKNTYVLYVEDDEDDVLLFTESIKAITDLPVMNLPEASQVTSYLEGRVNGAYPCVLLIDINLPKHNGMELLKQIKSSKHHQDLPIFMFSTAASLADLETCKKLGVEVLTKPSTINEWYDIGRQLVKYCDYQEVR